MGEPILSADDLSSPDTFVAAVPYELFSRLRREEPVAWSADHAGGGFWSITRHADVVAVTRDVGTFSSAKGGTFLDELPDEQLVEQRLLLVNMDPPAHSRYRTLVAAAFAPKSVAKMEQAVRQRVKSLVNQAVGLGHIDFVTDVAARLPLEVICDLMGISPADHALMLAWSNRLMASDDPELNVTPADVVEAGAEAVGYFCGLAEERRRRPGGDLISTLVTAEVSGERLSELELGLFCILLLVGGNETTRNTIAHGVLALAQHPEQRRRLREDPALLPVAVDELLRYSSALLQFRRTATLATPRLAHSASPRATVSSFGIHRPTGTSPCSKHPMPSTSPEIPTLTWPSEGVGRTSAWAPISHGCSSGSCSTRCVGRCSRSISLARRSVCGPTS